MKNRITAGVLAGAEAAALAASFAGEGPPAALGLTDPRPWSAPDRSSDAVPHLAYGLVTAVTYDRPARWRHREIR